MSAFENTRERKLFKEESGFRFYRTITIEDRNQGDGDAYQVTTQTKQEKGKNYGLRNSEKPDDPTFTVQITPPNPVPRKTLEDAIEHADREFKTSVDFEKFKPVAIGEDFPA